MLLVVPLLRYFEFPQLNSNWKHLHQFFLAHEHYARISHKTVGAGSQICFNHSRISRKPAPTASGLGFHKFGEKSGYAMLI
jgi:hypothetical protein